MAHPAVIEEMTKAIAAGLPFRIKDAREHGDGWQVVVGDIAYSGIESRNDARHLATLAAEPTITRRVADIMAGAGVHPQPDGTFIAKCGAMNTQRGHGTTRELAMSYLERKIRRIVVRQMSK